MNIFHHEKFNSSVCTANALNACVAAIALFAAMSLLSANFVFGADDLDMLEQKAIQAAVAHVDECVVRIETVGGAQSVDKMRIGTGPTTGTIIDQDGYIISSSFNFLQAPSSILVTIPNRKRAAAKIIGRDESRKLVLLKVETSESLPVPAFARKDEVQVGETSIAIGKTFSAEEPNVSVGIISALDRVWGRAVQTDAKISPLNYGGPLIDLKGRVIGILVPMSPDGNDEVAGFEWYDSGIGFAVAADDILKNLDAMKSGETIHRGLLGISLKGENVQVDRAIISNCLPNSPAFTAGLKAGDEVTRINSTTITNQAQMKQALGNMDAGEEVEITVSRSDETITRKITLAAEVLPYDQPFLGILPARTTSSGPEDKQKVIANSAGIHVRHVFADSCIEKAGVNPGDAIIEIDGQKITDAADLRAKLRAFQAGDEVNIKWTNGEKTQEALIRLDTVSTELPEVKLETRPDAERDANVSTGVSEFRIVAEENRGVIVVPENIHEFANVALVIHFDPPGKLDKQKIEKDWLGACQSHGMIVLVIEPIDEKRWTSTEIAFVRKAVDDVVNRYQIDPNRIVAHGNGVGGAFAFLAALAHREVFRSVVSLGGSPPARMSPPVVDPNYPLLMYWSESDDKLAERSATIVEALNERKFPLKFVTGKQPGDLREEVLNWIETLDRL